MNPTTTTTPEPYTGGIVRRHFFALLVVSVLLVQTALVWGQHLDTLPDRVIRARIYMPGVIAVALTLIADGWQGVKRLLGPLLQFRIDWRWYVFAFLYPPFICVLPIYLLHFLGFIKEVEIDWAQIDLDPRFIKFIVTISICEEIGFVSAGIERLKTRYTVFVAALLGGTLWGLYYVPLNVAEIQIAGKFPNSLLIINFMFIAALTAWLYLKTKSAIVVALMQVVTNFAATTFPVLPRPGNMTNYLVLVALKGIFVVALYRIWGPRPLLKRPPPVATSAIA